MFHDASVSRIEQNGNALHIETEAFSVGPGERMQPARIVVESIGAIFCNDERIDRIAIESDDAEIYGFDVFTDRIELHLIWHWHGPDKREAFTTYRFPGATALVEDLAGGPPVLVPEAHSG